MYKIKDITSRDGSYKLNIKYAQSLGLSGKEEIIKERCVTSGTSYNYTYECILENGDTFIYRTSGWDGFSTLGYPYLIKKDSKKDYARKVGILCKKYKFDFETGLTLGTEEKRYSFFNKLIPFKITKDEEHVLEDCGINRRIKALVNILGRNIYGLEIRFLGQTSSSRLAEFVLKNSIIIKDTKCRDNIQRKMQEKINAKRIKKFFSTHLEWEISGGGYIPNLYLSKQYVEIFSIEALDQFWKVLQEKNIKNHSWRDNKYSKKNYEEQIEDKRPIKFQYKKYLTDIELITKLPYSSIERGFSLY